jgi:hypothetical protein
MTYLHPITGDKLSDLPVPKRSLGTMKGAFVHLNKGIEIPHITFVAEGIETALSIKEGLTDAQQQCTQVLATLGKSNIMHLAEAKTAPNIVLVLDNDKLEVGKDKVIRQAISALTSAGKSVHCIQPTLLNGDKTDYNDLAKAHKMDVVQADVQRAYAASELAEKIKGAEKRPSVNQQKSATRDLVMTDRELIG